jgi:hypothetical protein
MGNGAPQCCYECPEAGFGLLAARVMVQFIPIPHDRERVLRNYGGGET